MGEIKNKKPKVFISYSHTSKEHEKWVLELSTRLCSDGIEVKLDKWDLREGHEKNFFMEQMKDENIDKVLIICDRIYQKKANNREYNTGTNTESQIISEEVYKDVKQEKFIPIIKEYNDYGQPCTPTYLESRIYIDLSSEDVYEENYEKLVRNIYNKPLFKRPTIGEPPSYIMDDLNIKPRLKLFTKRKDNYNLSTYNKDFYTSQKLYEALKEIKKSSLKKDFIKVDSRSNCIENYLEKYIEGDPKERKDEFSKGADDYIKNCIEKTDGEILVACWSFTSLADKFEVSLLKFLRKKNSKLKILMLMPGSKGFFEKSAFEAFENNFTNWIEIYNQILERYKENTINSLKVFKNWIRKVNKKDIQGKIDAKFYTDTPRVSGFSFDRRKFSLTYYFIDPIARGYTLPVVVVDDKDMLAIEFLNWFDLKFALGMDVSQIRL